ncbi:hypothetical protein IAQ61_008276 [Plenodomus lingam]|uniref:uncharacterized protein n=1 Tax=Leptosphaeria maculans TaxID=5022 RepID=UPI00332E0EF3|nr:hypothetical protein IAQ61_008276 [Plenodomus lingam]
MLLCRKVIPSKSNDVLLVVKYLSIAKRKRVIPVIIGTDILKALNKLDGTLAWYNLGFGKLAFRRLHNVLGV